MNDQTRSTGVTIRTSDNDSNIVYITLNVQDGEIVSMFAGANPGGAEHDVRNIKFTLRKNEALNDECKCCVKDPVTGKITCFPCPC